MKMLLTVKFQKLVFRYFLLLILVSTMTTYLRFTNEYYSYMWKFGNKKVKFILLWSGRPGSEWKYLKDGDISFTENKCSYNNCYVTEDRTLLGYYTDFDAIIIDGKAVSHNEDYDLPKMRLSEQVYVFATQESSANFPVCDPKYDGFFNLTWTYRLDSDVVWPYFFVHDHESNIVGPKIDVQWTEFYLPITEEYTLLFGEKDQAAVWIASNCFTTSRREMLVNNLKYFLKTRKLHVETVGSCGLKKCPLEEEQRCLKHLYKSFFYFAFENAISEDYVSEKVVKAFDNYVVPVVFGGANFTRFLPPHSYIDAGKMSANETASLLEFLIDNHVAYLEYFRWRNHYYVARHANYVCDLCETLNKRPQKVYTDFRKWWNPKYIRAYGRDGNPRVCKKK